MCDPVDFSSNSNTEPTPEVSPSSQLQRRARSEPESLRSKIESLTSSTCWQWNAAVELLSTLPDDAKASKRRGIQWRNNYVYSSLLKLQDKAQEFCNGKTNSAGRHKNGPELTMSILDDMIQHNVIPDAVTCTLAIKAMGRVGVSSSSIQSAAKASGGDNNNDNNNLAVNFLEQMKSNPKLPRPNQYSYSAAIKACARLKDHRTALRLLEEMRNDYFASTVATSSENAAGDSVSTTPPPNTWVYNAALLSLDNKEKNNSQPTTKKWRNKQMIKLWTQRDEELNQQDRTQVALSLLDQMKDDNQHHGLDTKPDTVTYNTVLGMGTFPHRPATNATELAPSKTISAMSLIDEMKVKGITRDQITYRNAIDSSLHDTDPMDILQGCLEDTDMIDRKSGKPNGRAVTGVFNTGLYVLAARQDFAKFKESLTLMFEHEIPPNDETLTVLIHAVGKNGKGSSMEDLMNLLETTDDAYSSTNSSMHQELMDSVGLIENLGTFRNMPALGDSHYAHAINICLKENEFGKAYTILSKMRARGISPSTSCMEGFALAYAQSAMDATALEKKQKPSNDENPASVSRSRAGSAYKIAMALSRPRASTLGRVARACAMTGQWKLSRALLQSIHSGVLAPKEDGAFVPINSRLLQTIRGTHSFVLRECAKQGSVYAALHYTNDIQEFSKKIRAKHHLESQDHPTAVTPMFAEIPSDEDDIFRNLRSITETPSSKTNVGMHPNDWMSVIQAASKSGHWRVCFNTLQFLRPYVERTNPVHGEKNYQNAGGYSCERYNQLTYALYAVTRSLESHSQYAWSVRVIEDWIEWSGRQPRVESVLSAVRVLSKEGRVEEVRKLMATCLDERLMKSIPPPSQAKNSGGGDEDRGESRLSYEETLYVGAVTALHNNGLYDDADEVFMSGIHEGFLPFPLYREKDGLFFLDLHGLNVALAHSVVRIAMRQQAAALVEEDGPPTDLTIITGKGKNSKLRLKPVLRPEVQRMLLEEFYPPLNTMSVPGNIGALKVLAGDIQAWQEQQQKQKGIRMLKLAVVLRNLSSQEMLKTILARRLEESSENNDNESG